MKPPTPQVLGLYLLTPEAAELLSAAAALAAAEHGPCWRCGGTGISGWRAGGRRPIVCRCSLAAWTREAEEQLAAIERAQSRVVTASETQVG